MRHEIAFSTRIARTARMLALALAALGALSSGHAAVAAEPTPDEVKARFVFQLLKYVSWPEAAAPASAPFVVGVLGDDGFAATLRQVVGAEQAQGRAVEVRTLAEVQPGIHLLFLADKDAGNLRNLAREQHGTAVLTVANRFDFPELGGDVGLELVSGRVSFSINRRKSVRGDLVISSKLMRLASEVK